MLYDIVYVPPGTGKTSQKGGAVGLGTGARRARDPAWWRPSTTTRVAVTSQPAEQNWWGHGLKTLELHLWM